MSESDRHEGGRSYNEWQDFTGSTECAGPDGLVLDKSKLNPPRNLGGKTRMRAYSWHGACIRKSDPTGYAEAVVGCWHGRRAVSPNDSRGDLSAAEARRWPETVPVLRTPGLLPMRVPEQRFSHPPPS